MKTCPKCRKVLPSDSEFCQYCGTSLITRNFQETVPDENPEGNSRKNEFGKYAVLLMILTALVFDYLLRGIFVILKWNPGIVAWISTALYILCILSAVFSFVIDHNDRKHGIRPSGDVMSATAAICTSFLFILMNLQLML